MNTVSEPRSTVTLTFDLSRLPGVATAAGVSLVSAAVVIAAGYSRHTGRLDHSNFTMGALAALGLLAFAVGCHYLVPTAERSSSLVSWPGAAGALGTGLMLGVLIDSDASSTYLGFGLSLVLSVGGYFLTRAGAFALSALLSLALLYVQLFDDVVDSGDSQNGFMIAGAGVLIFVLVATAIGWSLPATRILTGVVVGAGGLVAMLTILGFVIFARFSSVFFGFSSSSSDDGSGFERPGLHEDPFKNDVYVVLLYCVVLALFWAGCALSTGHVGFKLLILGTGLTVLPLAALALMTDHPTWWEVVACAVGGPLLLVVAYRTDRGAPSAPQPPVASPA